MDFCGPDCFRVCIDFGVEAFDQLACEGGALFVGQTERLKQELL
jgi:hypothetical protein